MAGVEIIYTYEVLITTPHTAKENGEDIFRIIKVKKIPTEGDYIVLDGVKMIVKGVKRYKNKNVDAIVVTNIA